MAVNSGAWGLGGWGVGPWGGASTLDIAILLIIAHRENAFRFEFSLPVNWTRLEDDEDASVVDRWSVVVVPNSVGMDENPARPVNVSSIVLPGVADGIARPDVGRFVDVYTDRTLSPYPALYDVSCDGIFAKDLGSSISQTVRTESTHALLVVPRADYIATNRDFANAMTLDATVNRPQYDPANPLGLGTFQYDDTGDLATDEGLVNLKKRCIRRLAAEENGFAHLPGYGLGVKSEGKMLSTAARRAGIAARAESILSREPDVLRVKVTLSPEEETPGLFRLRILVKPKVGPAFAFSHTMKG